MHGRVVGVLDLKSVGPGFESRLKLPHNSLQFRLTQTCLFDQFSLLSVRTGMKHITKANLETMYSI